MNARISTERSHEAPPAGREPISAVPLHLRILAVLLRGLFIGVLLVVTARVSAPQSESIWSAYETPGDIIRLALGVAVSLWILVHLFRLPRDAEGYRTWVYFGLVALPFAVALVVAIW